MLIARHELELHRIVVDKTYEPGSLDFHGAEFRQVDPLEVKAVGELAGEDISIHGSLKARIEASCDRCLKPVAFPVEREFDLTYRPVSTIAREEEWKVPHEELDIGFYEGAGVQLTEVLAEQVILALPMKLVCAEGCLGLCPVCGANRNLRGCSCPEPRPASPFAALRGE